MRRIIVDVDERDIVAYEALARAKKVDLAEIISAQIKLTAELLHKAGNLAAEALATEALAGQIQRDLAALSFDEPENTAAAQSTLEQRRAARRAILRGDGTPLWEGEEGKPKDGLIYQRELRAEW
jgi:hypothetical protein